MRILFLIPYPIGRAASQRFRFEQYLEILKAEGYEYEMQSFLDESTWSIFYRKGHYAQKILGLAKGFWRRFWILTGISTYDLVFIHRESEPIGPPIIEFLLVRLFRKKIIYDLDDAIWIPNTSENNRFFSPLKWHSNSLYIASIAQKVSAGNQYLADHMALFNNCVIVNPTTIDTSGLHNRISAHQNERSVIGWTGSHSTLAYLDVLFPIIRKIKMELDFDFVIISDTPPSHDEDLFEFIPWKKDSEIQDLLRMNIGLMPLVQDEWSQGKCGFKALQYMSLGIPALVSPVGVNEIIVDDGINGFICHSENDWMEALRRLLIDRDLCRSMGKAAREKIEARYSVHSNRANFLHLFS